VLGISDAVVFLVVCGWARRTRQTRASLRNSTSHDFQWRSMAREQHSTQDPKIPVFPFSLNVVEQQLPYNLPLMVFASSQVRVMLRAGDYLTESYQSSAMPRQASVLHGPPTVEIDRIYHLFATSSTTASTIY
jgi:hypothetical protein